MIIPIIVTILVIVFVVSLLLVIRRLWYQRLKRQQKSNLDFQMTENLPRLLSQVNNSSKQYFISTIPNSIWHRNVFVFEYQLNNSQFDNSKTTASQLTKWLNNNLTLSSPVVITECWCSNDVLHFDIAYLINQATIDYVQDMQRIDNVDEVAAVHPPVKQRRHKSKKINQS